jgi:hypothetical protein
MLCEASIALQHWTSTGAFFLNIELEQEMG